MKSIVVLLLIVLTVFGPVSGHTSTYAQEGEPGLREQINSYLTSLVDAGFSGAVLVAREGEIILQGGYGLANDADGQPVTADTVFLFGSITKQFTAAAILHLEMQGHLNTEDRISDYLEAVPADKADITIHQLLTHSSGLRSHVFNDDFLPITRDEAVRRILDGELLFEPGTGVEYSDDGFKLLAAILEIASGGSWQDYLENHLFRPAGMEHTGFFNDAKWQGHSVANGYNSGRDKGAPSQWPGPYWALIGAGGVMSTVGDMYRWYLALQEHTILSKREVEKLWSPYESISSRSSFGYGWSIVETEDRGRLIETTGASTSHNAYFHISEDDDLVVIVASNRIDEPLLSRLRMIERQETFFAVQVGDSLVANIKSRAFDMLPEFAGPQGRPLRPTSMGYAVAGITAAGLIAGIWIYLRRGLARS